MFYYVLISNVLLINRVCIFPVKIKLKWWARFILLQYIVHMQYLRLACSYVMCIFLETGVLFQKVMTIATKSKKLLICYEDIPSSII